MASRRANSRDSDRTRNRTGGVSLERIRSGDVSEALTEVLCEETRLPRESSFKEGKEVDGKKASSRPSSNSPTGSKGRDRPQKQEDPDSVAHLVRHFKPAGCLLPSLRNMTERDAYAKMAVSHDKFWLFLSKRDYSF
ncbi:hypothetical protein Bca101_067878 [Brassica carinata]